MTRADLISSLLTPFTRQSCNSSLDHAMHACTSHASWWAERVGRLPTDVRMMKEKRNYDEPLAVE